MPGSSTEYSKPTVSAGGCSYSTLNAYNQNYFGRSASGAPVMSQTRSNEVVVVPSFGGPGYNLGQSMKRPSCSGYHNIKGAYPNYPNACGLFSSNLCG